MRQYPAMNKILLQPEKESRLFGVDSYRHVSNRQGDYYSAIVTITNTDGVAYPRVSVEATVPTASNDLIRAETGHVFVAKTPEVFGYDADGNLTNDSRFAYRWNAENRLIRVETLSGLPPQAPRIRLTMDYDHQGRRIGRMREAHDGTNWVWQENRAYIYDGWNLVGESVSGGSGSTSTTNWYIWGLDLSETLQGAGGVGGLLAAVFSGEPELAEGCYYTYDGNGNVSDLVGASGTILGHYEYDPFGNLTAEQGTLAVSNPFRFSTKYWDGDTKLLAYQLRDFNPGLGRWVSRDPIEEEVNYNLYAYFYNDHINSYDYLGLQVEKCTATLFVGHNSDTLRQLPESKEMPKCAFVGGIACRGEPGDVDINNTLRKKGYSVIPNLPPLPSFVSPLLKPSGNGALIGELGNRLQKFNSQSEENIGAHFGKPEGISWEQWGSIEEGYKQYELVMKHFAIRTVVGAVELCKCNCDKVKAKIVILPQNVLLFDEFSRSSHLCPQWSFKKYGMFDSSGGEFSFELDCKKNKK